MKAMIALLLGMLLSLNVGAADEGATFSADTLTLQSKTAKGEVFKLRLERSTWSGPYGNMNLWGASGRKPSMVLSALKATAAGEDLYVPLSAYADLAEPETASIQRRGANVVLIIRGGAGADAYTSTLTFKNGQVLVSKSTRSVVMPKDVWEEIRYGLMVDN